MPQFEWKQNKQFCYIYRILCWLSSPELLLCTVWSHGERTKCQILGKCSHTMRHLWIPIRMPILCCASNWESRLYEAYLSRQVWLASELCAPSSNRYSSTPSQTWYLFYNKYMSDSAKPTLSTKYQHSVDQYSPPRIILYFILYMHQTVYRIVLSCHKHCHF